jgi:hypothetical protein
MSTEVTTRIDAPAVVAPLIIPESAPLPEAPAKAPMSAATRKRILIIGGAAAAFLLIILAGVAIGTAISSSRTPVKYVVEGPSDEVVDTEPEAEATTAPDPSPTPTAQPVDPPVQFQSTSGNIKCRILPDLLVCHQTQFKYTKPAAACSTGPTGVTIGLTQQGGVWPCLPGEPAESPAQPYDSPVVAYGYTCSINYDTGIRCDNGNGSGFSMEYERGIATY